MRFCSVRQQITEFNFVGLFQSTRAAENLYLYARYSTIASPKMTRSGSPLSTLKPREVCLVAKESPDLAVDLLSGTCDY
jgi:hypothetical protein